MQLHKYFYPIHKVILILLALPAVCHAEVAPSDYRQQLSEKVWEENLKPANFPDQQIIEGAAQKILEIKAPYSAEDATVVPISIHTNVSQKPESYIRKIHVYVDKNPVPLVGVFEFTPGSGRADLAMRIRVDDFSYVRAIAEMNNGDLYMAKSFVRAKGACSAPPPAGMEDSRKLLGTMKMNTIGDVVLGKPNLLQLMIRHPNITGMAPLKVGSHIIPPAHFVKALEVEFNGQLIMKAQLTFSVSMDPAFRFYFVPDKEGTISVKGVDTQENHFSSSYEIKTS
jgi:sulfur-oxidizing protein SoxY